MSGTDLETLKAARKGTLGETLGIEYIEASKQKVVAELAVRAGVTTIGGAMHGGALMALADQVGAMGAFINLPQGALTTTLESKTNFFAAARAGKVRAEATPIHIGRTTMVWQTRITDENGKLISQTIQTQMVLMPKA